MTRTGAAASDDVLEALAPLDDANWYFRIERVSELGLGDVAHAPLTVKILLENILRNARDVSSARRQVAAVCGSPLPGERAYVSFFSARVVLQDHSGIPVLMDLAALRDEAARRALDPRAVRLSVPADLVVDHSVQVDAWRGSNALLRNMALERERNAERYEFLDWAARAFEGLRVVPPGRGIVHQVNLERLATCVRRVGAGRRSVVVPDTVLGTDSHTPMVNALGVLGWGVGGIEATNALLGQPTWMPRPRVVGVRLHGELARGATATDLVLVITESLRRYGVTAAFVEFFGPAVGSLGVPDRATVSNMAPEYGATSALFPVDARTLEYLEMTGRPSSLVALVERYCRAQGMFDDGDGAVARFDDIADVDLGAVEASAAGPHRPQDRRSLRDVWRSFVDAYPAARAGRGDDAPGDGSIAIAAITSCTNTSNPRAMVTAGLVARNAVDAGIAPRRWVKTSLAPGSRVVTRYLDSAGLLEPLGRLGFDVIAYGCTTCIGNSGPLDDEMDEAIRTRDLVAAAVLSGNRNFQGRIHPLVRAVYLCSPPLVVAYALAGTLDVDLTADPIGVASDGTPVRLRDLWPSEDDISGALRHVTADAFAHEYGDELRPSDRPAVALTYAWDAGSTYVVEPPWFRGVPAEPAPLRDIVGARALLYLGDSVTTDHISPAGAIADGSPAARWLRAHGVRREDFNTYGCRRGNHLVMAAGTFASTRLRNKLVERDGGYTTHFPTGAEMLVPDAAAAYARDGTPLIVLAGRDYGMGSSRDWAAKGPALLGVVAVIARSFERIHRSNLVCAGVLPLQFPPGESAEGNGLSGDETFDVRGVAGLAPGATLTLEARRPDGSVHRFPVLCRVDTPAEIELYRHGGVMPCVLRERIGAP